jgi:hypothetical protein
LSHLRECGLTGESQIINDILRLAYIEGDGRIDLDLLFHVVSQAVQKVLDRNGLFWNTVISVSSSTIAWVDFRRKLSKWLSNNGASILHVKNVLQFVEVSLDKDGIGVIRKDAFLKFTADIMGIDCLVSPDVIMRRQIRSPTISIPPQPKGARTVEMTQPVRPLLGEIPRPSPMSSLDMAMIRMRLAVGILEKALDNRKRSLFTYYRVRSLGRDSRSELVWRSTDGGRISQSVSSPTISPLVVTVRKLLQRIKSHAFYTLLSNPDRKIPTSHNPESAEESSGGLSWTVTMQAMALASLHGILRTALARAIYPGYLCIRTGKTVDEVFAIRRISYAQSQQGKKDSQTALPSAERSVLEAIKENLPTNNLEFDLSI